MKNISIKKSFTIAISTLAILSAIIVALVVAILAFDATKVKIKTDNEKIAIQAGNSVDRFISISKNVIVNLSHSSQVTSMDSSSIKNYFDKVMKTSKNYELIFVTDTDGNQIVRTSGELKNRADREYFQKAMKGEVFITDPYVSASSQKPCITISAPIYNNHGEIVGTIGADVALNMLTDIATGVKVGKNGYINIIDKNMSIIYSPDKKLVKEKTSLSDKDYAKSVNSGEKGSVEEIGTKGEKSIISYAPVGHLKWGVVTYYPKEELRAEDWSIGKKALIATAIMALISIMIGIYISNRFTKPLILLSRLLERVANYDLNIHDDKEFLDLNTHKNELGEISRQTDRTVTLLKQLIKNISNDAQTTAATAEELTATSQSTSNSANGVAQAVNNIAEGATSQAQDTTDAASNVDNIKELLNSTNVAFSKLENSFNSINNKKDEGQEVLSNLINTIEINNKSTKDIKDVIIGANKSAEDISKASEMIQSISDQTNLLALNAAIEAARAGEAGKGFAVVAGEIGKLAEQSAGFTDEIKKVIEGLKYKTESAVTTMEEIEKNVLEQNNSTARTKEKFEEIAEAVSESKEMIDLVGNSSKKVIESTDRLINIIENLSAIAEENAATTEQASASVDSQVQSIKDISKASEGLASIATTLQEEVLKFKF